MLNNRPIFCIALVLSLLLGGCRPPDLAFPAESSSGWNTFGCVIGDHFWQLKQNRLADGFYQLESAFGGRTFSLTAEGRCGGLASSFELYARNISEIGTYPMAAGPIPEDSAACMATFILTDGYKIYQSDPALGGAFEVFGMDTLTNGSKYIAGRFSFTLRNITDSTDLIEVTRGRFDAALN